jgi:nucleotide-binding universal stress UspA family protein
VTRFGDPAREIVSAAAELGAALIVVGKRGADFAPVGSLGSVARMLMGFSSLPVLAVDFA